MLTQIQVIGLETGDSVPALLVVTERHRYLFNAGEGLQRFCMEHRMRLSRVDGIFLTRVCADTCGGLPGLILTVADMGKSSMRVYGGPGLADLLFGFRNFMRRDDVALHAVQARVNGQSATASTTNDACITAGELASVEFGDLTVTPILVQPAAGVRVADPALASPPAAPRALGDTHAALREALSHPALTATAPVPLCGGSSRPASASGRARERPDVSWYPKTASEAGKKGNAGAGAQEALPSPVPAARRSYSSPFNPFDASWWPTAAEGWGTCTVEGVVSEEGPVPLAVALSEPQCSEGDGVSSLPTSPSSSVAPSLCYLLRTEDVPGTFQAGRAKALGIPTGPVLGTLSRGLPVLLDRPMSALQALLDAGSITPADILTPEAAAAAAATGVLWVKDGANGKGGKKGGKQAAAPATDATPHPPPEPTATLLIQPGWVKDPDRPGYYVGVVDAPTLAHAAAATAHTAWAPFCSAHPSSSSSSVLQALYHLTPSTVVATPAYQQWMTSFGPGTKHVMLCPPTSPAPSAPVAAPLMYYSQTAQIMKLHTLCPDAFPLPHPATAMLRSSLSLAQGTGPSLSDALRTLLQSLPAAPPAAAAAASVPVNGSGVSSQHQPALPPPSLCGLGSVVQASPLLTHRLIPVNQAGMYTESAARATELINPVTVMQELAIDPVLREMLQPGVPATSVPSLPPSPGAMPADARILFTGTASAIPSKYRNVSGIVLFPRPGGASGGVVLDCGEGTWGQLVRALASEAGAGRYCSLDTEATALLLGLRLIWISHMHADHHLGIARLLTERAKLATANGITPEPLLVIGPTRLYVWLLEASTVDTRLRGLWRFADAEHFRVSPVAPPPAVREVLAVPTLTLSTPVAAAPVSAAAVEEAAVAAEEEDTSPTAGDTAPPSPKRMRMSDSEVSGPTCAGLPSFVPAPAAPASAPVVDAVTGADGKVTFQEVVPEPRLASFWESFHTRVHPVVMPVPGPDAERTQAAAYLATPSFVSTAFAAIGITALRAVRVQHCHKAYAVRLEMGADERAPAGWSLVYSGDTRPTWEVAALTGGQVTPTSLWNGTNTYPVPLDTLPLASLSCHGPLHGTASILIHEATFEDTAEDRAHAVDKHHSTAQEAGLVAETAGVPTLILTHFSARYPKLPVLKQAHPSSTSPGPAVSTLVAYDLMSVWGRDIPMLPSLLPALHRIFAEPAEDADA